MALLSLSLSQHCMTPLCVWSGVWIHGSFYRNRSWLQGTAVLPALFHISFWKRRFKISKQCRSFYALWKWTVDATILTRKFRNFFWPFPPNFTGFGKNVFQEFFSLVFFSFLFFFFFLSFHFFAFWTQKSYSRSSFEFRYLAPFLNFPIQILPLWLFICRLPTLQSLLMAITHYSQQQSTNLKICAPISAPSAP